MTARASSPALLLDLREAEARIDARRALEAAARALDYRGSGFRVSQGIRDAWTLTSEPELLTVARRLRGIASMRRSIYEQGYELGRDSKRIVDLTVIATCMRAAVLVVRLVRRMREVRASMTPAAPRSAA